MKLIEQTQLLFQSDKSDKVYQVGIYEINPTAFSVRFKYGRRAYNLREGIKTDVPVTREKAFEIYQKLIEEKERKGYLISTGSLEAEVRKPIRKIDFAKKEQTILNYLETMALDPKANLTTSSWNPSRVVWRAGELKIYLAVPYLNSLLGKRDELFDYCVLWALGRCGNESSLDTFYTYTSDQSKADKLRRIAREGVLAFVQGADRAQFLEEVRGRLPEAFQRAILNEDAVAFDEVLNTRILGANSRSADLLEWLYLLAADDQMIRTSLLKVLKTIPLKTGNFRAIRHLFKAAEFRADGEVFGLIAYRVEKSKENYTHPKWWDKIWMNRNWVNVKEEVKKKNPKISYSNRTREYFKRRTWRTLQRLGEDQSEDYVKMAVGVLLPFDDQVDFTRARKTVQYSWVQDEQTRRWNSITKETHYDDYSGYITFNHILYQNSPRYELKRMAKAWSCKETYRPGQPEPKIREEAFPKLWNKKPEGLIHLLTDSNSKRVHHFAVRAVRANSAIFEKIDVDLLKIWLTKPFESTVLLALEIAEQKYNPLNPDKALVSALIHSPIKAARSLGEKWINDQPSTFMNDAIFIKSLILSPFEDVRNWIKDLLPTLDLSEDQQSIIIASSIAEMLNWKTEKENERIQSVSEILRLAFPNRLATINLHIIRDLLKHPLSQAQIFAGQILWNHEIAIEDLPDDIVQNLLQAKSPNVRSMGIQLIGKLPDDILMEKKEMLVGFCVSPFEEVRKAVKPIIGKLVKKEASFGEELVDLFVPQFFTKESYKGLHADLRMLLTKELSTYLHRIDKPLVLRLLAQKRKVAKAFGLDLLKQFITEKDLTLRQIIKIAGNEMVEARETAWKLFGENVGRIRYERDEAIRLLDVTWEDSRIFGFEFFRKEFSEKDWTPQLLVSLCDSTRDDVQQFGLEMITQFFKKEDGPDYLLKLSQHPSAKLQEFASNYLEEFATDHIERIKSLVPYFTTVLSQVNKSRVAKLRVFNFVKKEAIRNPETAELIVDLIARVSATISKKDKYKAIEILHSIQEKYPHITIPPFFKKVEIKVISA